MKNLFKPKSLKVCAISIVVSSMALVGYNAYSNATMTPEERLFQQNLEALTSGEDEIIYENYVREKVRLNGEYYLCCMYKVGATCYKSLDSLGC